MRPSPTLPDDVPQSVFKIKEDKKLDKSKRDSSKYRESKRKERSSSRSPSKKEVSRKSSHKKIDRKERSPRSDKYHKRRDEKKNKEPEVKKKSASHGVKIQQNETTTINSELPSKEDEKIFREESKSDNLVTDLPIIEPVETIVPKKKDVITEVVHEPENNNSSNITSELVKTDSPLEDSDSLKRLRMYMQTMKKSPEPSTAVPVEQKNELDTHAVKSNQSKIKMSDQLYFIKKCIVGELLLFLNKLNSFLRHIKIKNHFTFPLVLSSWFFYTSVL